MSRGPALAAEAATPGERAASPREAPSTISLEVVMKYVVQSYWPNVAELDQIESLLATGNVQLGDAPNVCARLAIRKRYRAATPQWLQAAPGRLPTEADSIPSSWLEEYGPGLAKAAETMFQSAETKASLPRRFFLGAHAPPAGDAKLPAHPHAR